MSYQLNVEVRPDYLYVNVTGENSTATKNDYLTEVRETCIKKNCFNLLIVENLTGSSLDTFSIYNLVAGRSGQASLIVKKLAFVDLNPEHNVENLEFAENVAVNRGLRIKVCSTVRAAQEWIESNA